ncbi:phosphatidylinositol 4,5-bisphosphate-binding protein, partial [Cryomyces antarcticus]
PVGSSRTSTEPNNQRTSVPSGIVFMGSSPSTGNDSQQKTRDVADLAFTDTSPSANAQPSQSEREDSNRTSSSSSSSPAHPPPSKLPLPVPISSPSAHGAATPAATYIAADPSDYLRSRGVPQEAKIGGLEAEGAHPTGRLFPKVLRHDTNMSIAQLHVPGEFPPPTPAPSGESAYPWRQAQ